MSTTKYCPTCAEIKSVEKFRKDKSRPDGREWRCGECAREAARIRNRKRQQKDTERKRKARGAKREKRVKQALTSPMMADELFEQVYRDRDLALHIESVAREHAGRNEDLFKSLQQDAWIRIAMHPDGQSIEALKIIAGRAIRSAKRRVYYRIKYRVSDLETMSREEYQIWAHGVGRRL